MAYGKVTSLDTLNHEKHSMNSITLYNVVCVNVHMIT